MGDPTHIIELIDQMLEETADRPDLQEKIFDLRDALLQAQQSAQQYNLKIKTLEETIRQLKLPAHRIGTILGKGQDNLYRLNVGGTEYQAAVSPEILENDSLNVGDQVAVNEGFVAIAKLPRPERGPIARIVSRLDDGHWMVGGGTNNSDAMVIPCADLEQETFKEGDEVILDPTQKVIMKRLPKRQSKTLVEDDYVPVTWDQVGGQEKVIEEVRKVIEYPILHEEILKKMEYRMPKGFLFYGPPGCGKTLIGRAILSDVVSQLKSKDGASQDLEGRFIHVKGPEILNMWLGESERKVREIFKRAREYKEKGKLPFIFIDEAESILGTRQALRVNNISNTLVPMFCAEMDGIQSARDMVVILATNRPDLIDPAILRPGRIDRKIKVGRPNRKDCQAILKVYLKPELPIEGDRLEDLVHPFLDHLFKKTPDQEALVLTLRNGEFQKLYWKDFISGAVLEGIVLRAKERAIERAIAGEELQIKADDLMHALKSEFTENSILPTDSNMEDWLQLLDFDPKKVVRVRLPDDSDQAASDTLSRSII
ncbi:MAG: AAA family ATPase [Nitrospina sp.]|nr:MAG: AAA family ATPase [Nitrospina sp.]